MRMVKQLILGLAVAMVAAPVCAQTAAPMAAEKTKGFLSLGAGQQFGNQTVTSVFPVALYGESGSLTATRTVKGGAFFDGTFGWRFGKKWGVALNASSRTAPSSGTMTGGVPDPLAYQAPRPVSSTMTSMAHTELAVSPVFVYIVPVWKKLDLMLLVGPALIQLKHDLVTSATVQETNSGPTVTPGIESISRSFLSFQVGGDLQYMMTPSLGFGGFVRYESTPANLSPSVKLTLGGVQAGGGVRIRF